MAVTRLLTLALCATGAAAAAVSSPPPHVIYVLVDDLGYAGVGYNSPLGEPITPRIDALATSGMKLRRHYTHMFCSPTRSSFLSGRLPIHVNQRNNGLDTPGGGVPVNMTVMAQVLRGAGYNTHHYGKWHAGFSRPAQLPKNRGFETSLAMLGGSADHFTNCARNCPGGYVDMWLNDAPARKLNGTYSEYRYTDAAVAAIRAHDLSHGKPIFIYLALQNTHEPMEYEPRFLKPYSRSIYRPRRIGLAMVSAVDEAVGNITDALKAKDMWKNTLLVFSSDNGGPHDHESNYPLRGSKGTRWEGGVRGVAFVAGGWLPSKVRGTTFQGIVHICDWYATLAAFAGADPTDHKAAAAGLPPIDSIDMSAVILGETSTSPRRDIVLAAVTGGQSSANSGPAIVSGKYKLLIGKQIGGYQFPGPTTPNTTDCYPCVWDCGAGCLFDLSVDEVEHVNIFDNEPAVVAALKGRIAEVAPTVYQSEGGGWNYADPAATEAVLHKYGGFWGPWQPDGPLAPPPQDGAPAGLCDDITLMCLTDPSPHLAALHFV